MFLLQTLPAVISSVTKLPLRISSFGDIPRALFSPTMSRGLNFVKVGMRVPAYCFFAVNTLFMGGWIICSLLSVGEVGGHSEGLG